MTQILLFSREISLLLAPDLIHGRAKKQNKNRSNEMGLRLKLQKKCGAERIGAYLYSLGEPAEHTLQI